MAIKLIVTEPFADFQKGDEITDSAAVEQTLAERRNHVVPVTVIEPAPDAKTKG